MISYACNYYKINCYLKHYNTSNLVTWEIATMATAIHKEHKKDYLTLIGKTAS